MLIKCQVMMLISDCAGFYDPFRINLLIGHQHKARLVCLFTLGAQRIIYS
jgi:hypothetical protein